MRMSVSEEDVDGRLSVEIMDSDSLAFVSNSFYDGLPSPSQVEEVPTVQYLHHRRESREQKQHSILQDNNSKKTKRASFTPNTQPGRLSLRDQLSHFRYSVRRSVDYAISLRGFHQQRLPSWEPILNSISVGKFMLAFSLILVPLGLSLGIFKHVHDIKYSYGNDCKSARDYLHLQRQSCIFCGGGKLPCNVNIHVPEDMKIPVFLYYELANFYHNHRHLVQSVDSDQISGLIFTKEEQKPLPASHSCAPFNKDENGKFYFPCGALANSMFTDYYNLQTETGYNVRFQERGIAMTYSIRYKYINPRDVKLSNSNPHHESAFYKYFIMPKDWTKEVSDEWWKGGGMENERWQNWMLPSSKPTFRKLYAIIEDTPDGCLQGRFCKGNYTMKIKYRYDVAGVGDKAFILATTSFMGAPNRLVPVLTVGFGVLYALCGFQLLRIAEFRYQRDVQVKASMDQKIE